MPKITVRCATCGKSIQRWPYQIRQNTSGTYFCSGECDGAHKRTGSIGPKGYWITQFGGPGGRKLDHRRIVEDALGRQLKSSEVVHHINGDKLDNRIENLEVLTQAEHMREHKPLSFSIKTAEAMLSEGGAPDDVAKALGVSKHTLEMAFLRRGRTLNSVRGRPRGARVLFDAERAIQLLKEGLSLKETGKRLGVSRPTVSKRLRRLGIRLESIRG